MAGDIVSMLPRPQSRENFWRNYGRFGIKFWRNYGRRSYDLLPHWMSLSDWSVDHRRCLVLSIEVANVHRILSPQMEFALFCQKKIAGMWTNHPIE